MFSSIIEGDSCLVNVNFIVKLHNRIHNYGRTNTCDTNGGSEFDMCRQRGLSELASFIVSQEKVGSESDY